MNYRCVMIPYSDVLFHADERDKENCDEWVRILSGIMSKMQCMNEIMVSMSIGYGVMDWVDYAI